MIWEERKEGEMVKGMEKEGLRSNRVGSTLYSIFRMCVHCETTVPASKYREYVRCLRCAFLDYRNCVSSPSIFLNQPEVTNDFKKNARSLVTCNGNLEVAQCVCHRS